MQADKHLRSVWTAIFLRRGGQGTHSRLWHEGDDVQNLSAGLVIVGDEVPVFSYQPEDTPPLVLTTRRLVYGSTIAPVDRILAVRPVDFGLKKKMDLTELQIDVGSGQTVCIKSESGPPYFGLWNILLHLARKNRRGGSATSPSHREELS